MSSNKIRLNVNELDKLVKWLNTLEDDVKQKVVSGNAILEIDSVQTGIGESLNVKVLVFSRSMGWSSTKFKTNISDFSKW